MSPLDETVWSWNMITQVMFDSAMKVMYKSEDVTDEQIGLRILDCIHQMDLWEKKLKEKGVDVR